MTLVKKTVAAALGLSMLMPALAFADSSSTIQTLLNQIKSLQQQLASIQQQRQSLEQQQKSLKEQQQQAAKTQQQAFKELTSNLRQGSIGDQVSALQAMLALDPELYPEKQVSGYFGFLTMQAVKRFQKKYGIEQTGYFGPKTMKKFNDIYRGRGASSTIATHWDDDDDDDISREDRQPGWNKITLCHKPGSDKVTLYVSINALKGHLKHGDTQGACAGSSNTDTVAPTYASIQSSNLSLSGATITWTTNENATSQVEYGTTTSYGTLTSIDNALVTNHSVTLAGLAANTTYHFRVWSKDAAGNNVASSDMTFTTTNVADTTAPSVSSVGSSNLTVNGATIAWTTNEGATSQVEYGTSTSYGTITTVDNTLVSGHSVALSGLTANTTYHYRVWSKDAANNVAVSGDYTFTTSAVADNTPPSITSVAASNLGVNSATITWTTNEGATSQVEYGTTGSYGTLTTIDNALMTIHTVALAGLTGGTTYHYRVWSKDAANNSAVSGDNTITTATPDTTAPVISNVSLSSVASTTATIGWTTNEAASGTVYYGTANPLNTNTAANQNNAAYQSAQSFNLSGLTASTTYYYVLVSKDGSGNTATSSQASFVTTS